MAWLSFVFNQKVALVLAALSIYGLLLIFISSESMNPKFLIASLKSKYLSTVDNSTVNRTAINASMESLQYDKKYSRYASVDSAPTKFITNNLKTITPSMTVLLPRPSDNLDNATNLIIGLMSKVENYTEAESSENIKDKIAAIVNMEQDGGNTTEDHQREGFTAIKTWPPPRTVDIVHASAVKTATVDTPRALITLFTTVRNSPDKLHIYHNTIRNWSLLRPWVKPILYSNNSDLNLTDFAHQHGWDVFPVPAKSRTGVPILRHMFLDAQRRSNSSFYGYVNGDILFNEGLIDTLKVVLNSAKRMKQLLIVGRRTNYKLTSYQNITSLAEVGRYAKIGKLFSTNAQDYFISTYDGYPWRTIPDFVVGRVGYDNWLVVTALVRRMVTIDTTKTVIALHQTGTDGNYAGHRKKPKGDTYVNYVLAGKKFDYSLGHVTCGQFYTDQNKTSIELLPRQQNRCDKLFKKYHIKAYHQTVRPMML